MAFADRYSLSTHAVIVDDAGRILVLKQTYGDLGWGLPGGFVDRGETVHEAIVRECREELGCAITLTYLSGIYYFPATDGHVCIFRCTIPVGGTIRLSAEHSAFRWTPVADLDSVKRQVVQPCLAFDGRVHSATIR